MFNYKGCWAELKRMSENHADLNIQMWLKTIIPTIESIYGKMDTDGKKQVCPNCNATDGYKITLLGDAIMFSCSKCPDIKSTSLINFGKTTIDDRLGMRAISYFTHNFKHFYDDGTKMAWQDAFRKAIDKVVDQLISEEVHCPTCDCVAVGDDKQENYYCFNCQKQFKKEDKSCKTCMSDNNCDGNTSGIYPCPDYHDKIVCPKCSEEMYFETYTDDSLGRYLICGECGNEIHGIKNPIKCSTCNGKGAFLCDKEDPSTQVECEDCKGIGYVEGKKKGDE